MSSYDQNLLDAVPRATRAQLQEGYNVDLLEHPPRRTPSVRSPPPQIPQPPSVPAPLTPGIAEAGSGEKFNSLTRAPAQPRSRTSFWRSRNGVITVFVIVIVVIGAVVGGAVGGTVKKGSSNNVDTTGATTGSSSGSSPAITVTPQSDTSTLPSSAVTQAVGGGRPTTGPSATVTASAI